MSKMRDQINAAADALLGDHHDDLPFAIADERGGQLRVVVNVDDDAIPLKIDGAAFLEHLGSVGADGWTTADDARDDIVEWLAANGAPLVR